MTNEERDIITRFISRVGGASQPGGFGGAATPAPLPPVDREADELIGQLMTQYPEARYRITQMAFVQEAALAEARNRMQQMQAEIEHLRQQCQTAAQGQPSQGQPSPGQPSQGQPSQPQHRGLFGGLFGGGGGAAQGGGPAPVPPQPQQQYAPPPQAGAPQYQPGMFQRSGSGFLGSALTTAAGVAGGLVAGNALMDLFSGNRGGFGGGGGFGGAGVPGSETINNYYGDQGAGGGPGGDPWGAGGAPPVDPGAAVGGADPWGAGGTAPDAGQTDPGQADPGWGNAGTSGTSGTGGAGGTTGGGGGSSTTGGGGGGNI
ncbi:MAG TPA: DUF2076 family protein [Acetobacteraceae bacterium]|jgi:hypothetical protein|nr:DUF2076 family protein [Acetobacteraceae bacterium]